MADDVTDSTGSISRWLLLANAHNMSSIEHVFTKVRKLTCRLYYSFASKDNLYIVMECISGVDLYSLPWSLGALDDDVARSYIAETILALEYCHTQVRSRGWGSGFRFATRVRRTLGVLLPELCCSGGRR